ncbi:MAG TPA: HEAT repeat domain-containing protein [Armatimonadota bacterium]|nr:HEAT repeat domain-containing protein [Armatimonadota bacterium]
MPADIVSNRLTALKAATTDERLIIAEELASLAPAASDRLIAALRHPNRHARWAAAHALGRGGITAAGPALRELLQDPQPRVARTAAWALGRIRDEESTPALIAAMRSPNSHLSTTAAWALGRIGTPDALEALSAALGEASPRKLRTIALAFAEIGPEAIESLVTLLRTGSVAERTRAAHILARFGENAVPLILPLLESTEVKSRRAAAHILGTLRIPAAGASANNRRASIEAGLAKALSDEDSRVRRNAARSAGALGLISARPALESLLGGDPEQVRVAANALAALGDAAAGPALQSVLDREDPALPEGPAQAVRRALHQIDLAPRETRRVASRLPEVDLPSRSDYLAVVTAGLEAVAWEEISARLAGASLKSFGEGTVTFHWTGSPQAGAILRSVRRLAQGGAEPKEIALARRLRRYRVRTLPASLEPTTAYALARLANQGERDVFVDLTCGSATIAIERALDGPARAILAGDIDPAALQAAGENVAAGAQPVRLVQWDARRIPLRDESVNAVVANLPYGRRSGEHQENLTLYPAILLEIDRILRGSGIAVLLTAEKRLLRRSLESHPNLVLVSEREIEAGGLRPSLFVLQK